MTHIKTQGLAPAPHLTHTGAPELWNRRGRNGRAVPLPTTGRHRCTLIPPTSRSVPVQPGVVKPLEDLTLHGSARSGQTRCVSSPAALKVPQAQRRKQLIFTSHRSSGARRASLMTG